MAHSQQSQFVKSVTTALGVGQDVGGKVINVLEVGSFDVNGSVRQFFPGSSFTGVDLISGPGVDLVCTGDRIPLEDSSFDFSVSCECFEHNPNWAKTFIDMHRLTREGGVILLTCATEGRAEHGTAASSPDASPGTQALEWNYYKNLTEKDFHECFEMKNLFPEYFFMVNSDSHDLYFVGLRGTKNVGK